LPQKAKIRSGRRHLRFPLLHLLWHRRTRKKKNRLIANTHCSLYDGITWEQNLQVVRIYIKYV
jgi:hypothetical protein